ncbi:nicotinate-nucleotide adenylyltransferase [Alkalihalobacillus sp. AL-G]|uniref:nicotinate-nucleotide adenylyltransferase n=1 Tax=Alkalihalobacillus sp. AL-G TaxID=2926399 RepID=UPI00272D9FCE|nr:nicotinate-nucleotide adenylyltransferase [Alkalihalobacillus sp. AL-G]WLD92153.1 nicotinate-nucleotide adenylyltransferase [Alkalihalobacillus sp. AL-G]
MKDNRIGILGGTFDPPHVGHLMIAKQVLEQCRLDRIWFIPSAEPPHKKNSTITKGKDRIEMVKRAIVDEDRFELCLLEFERQGLSYTIDTVKELKRMYPTSHLYFIIGGDMVDSLHTWDRIDELLNEITFIAVKRPGSDFKSPYQDSLVQVEFPTIDLSSTWIREQIKSGRTTDYYVTAEVRKYIEENLLYE